MFFQCLSCFVGFEEIFGGEKVLHKLWMHKQRLFEISYHKDKKKEKMNHLL